MKKNTYYIGLAVIILLFGVFATVEISRRLKNDTVVDDDRHEVGKKYELVTIGKAPDFSFTNQDGQTITNENYKGKVYLTEFFFTTCPTICPIMNRNMVKIQNKFKNSDLGIASFSINPTHDTPEVLKEYADEYGVTNPNWNLMTGDQEAIFSLANKGFNLYAGLGSEDVGGFEHSGLFALIDKNGNIVSRKDKFGNPIVYYDGTSDDGVEALIQDVKTLLKQ